MLERVWHALYVLAELLCVLGLLVLCVFKVQHFLAQPVSTAVSYQPSRPPAITICHQLVDEDSVTKLENEFYGEELSLWSLNYRTLGLLSEAKELVGNYSLCITDKDIPEVATFDSGSNGELLNMTKSRLKDMLNGTKDMGQLQLNWDHLYDYSAMNDTYVQLEGVLKESVATIQQALDAVGLTKLQTLSITMQTLDRLVNITDEIDKRFDRTPEWREPTPVRLLVEGSRRVDQFVISCLRGNVSCMPGDGGVWQLRHVLETKERCYTLLAPEEEISSEQANVVLELRGNQWRKEAPTVVYDFTTLAPENDTIDSGDVEGNATGTTSDAATAVTTDTATETTTEAVRRGATETTTEAISESTVTEGDSELTQEPTFYPIVDYNGSTPFPQLINATDEGTPIMILSPEGIWTQGEYAPPSYVESFNKFQGAPDAIQYVTYKVMLHAAPVPLLNAPGGLRERSFEIFNNQDWVEVDVRIEELRSLNRKSRSCEEDPAYSRGKCLLDCQAAAHARAAGCQLETVWPGTAQGLPECQTAAQLDRLRAELETPATCSCPRPCRQGRVSAVVQASSRTVTDHEVTVTVRLDGDMQVIEESIGYTAGSMLTDFGGNMGLTMGFSLLTIVELLKKITFGFLERDGV